MASELDSPEAQAKLSKVTGILSKFMPGMDFGAITEQVKGGLDEFKNFKIAIDLLAERVEILESRLSCLEGSK